MNNDGWFVVRMQFIYTDAHGREVRTRSTGDITMGSRITVDPGEYGVPDGATFRVHASVVAGRDKTSDESHVYQPDSRYGAHFTASGTTLSNRLTFNGYFMA